MNPIVLISLLVGAYWIGKRAAVPRPSKEPVALPPSVPEASPMPEGLSPEESANMAAWQAVSFDVDVFPSGAYVGSFKPPSSEDGVSTAPGCEAIAVGHGFWARLESEAAPFVDDMPPDEAWDEIRWKLIPAVVLGAAPATTASACVDQDTEAGRLFEDEILDRIASLRRPSLTVGGAVPVPQANRSVPTMGAAIAHQLRRRRYG